MANKAISELPQALNVNNQDLFVLEQSGIAKKLTAEAFITEQGIIDALAEALDGHGGIQSVTLSSVSGRIRTYLITFTDESATTFQVYDGTSIDRIVKTSTAGLTDTYTVFMNDGSTTFFTVTNGADGDVSEAMLNDALKNKAPVITETTESSAVANFTDGADNMVMHHVVAEINPEQDLSNGDPSPTNICPITGWTGANVYSAGKLYDEYPSDPIVTNGLTIKRSSNHRIKISGTITGQVDRYLSTAFVGTGATLELNVSQPAPYSTVYFYIYDTTANSAVLRMYGTTQTRGSFTTVLGHSYRFGILCPNNGGTYNMDFIATVTETSPTTISADWASEAGTVYGGTIDFATGLLTVDRKGVSLNGTEEWSATSAESLDIYILTVSDAVSVANDNTSIQIISDKYKSVSAYTATHAGRVANSIAIVTNTRIFVTVPSGTYADASAFKAALANSPLQVVYKLATPQTYQLTGQQLMTLLGTNNVWADTGNVSVTYPADTKLYIENLTQPTEDDLTANQAITSGKYFMIGNSLYLALANIASGAQITIGTNAQRVSLADALNTINS